MEKINKQAQEVIDRIKKVTQNYGEIWNEKEVIECMGGYYKELGIEIPKKIEIGNLVFGFTTARDAAWGAAWDAARDAARGAAWDAAWDAAWGAAWDAAWDAARGAAWGAAWDAAWGAAWDAAWGAACLNTNLKNEKILKFIAIENWILKALENGLGWYFPMKDKLILVPMPKLRINENNQLHSEINPAVEWKKEFSDNNFYFLTGVKFDKDLWQEITTKTISFEKAIKLENTEQRIIALKYIGGDKLFKELGGIVKAKDEYGELIELTKLKDIMNKNYLYLKAYDPSEKDYVWLRVNPNCTTPKEAEAQSYRLQMFNVEYQPISRT